MIGLQEFSGAVRRSRFRIGGLNLELLPSELISFSLHKMRGRKALLVRASKWLIQRTPTSFRSKLYRSSRTKTYFFVGAEVMPEKIVLGKALDQSASTTWGDVLIRGFGKSLGGACHQQAGADVDIVPEREGLPCAGIHP